MDAGSITGNSGVAPQPSGAQKALSNGIDQMANEQTFLKLFVAQLQNQDPMNPQDGTQFVAQLAQFSQLEQSLQMRQDLDGIRTTVQTAFPPPHANDNSGGTPKGTAATNSNSQ